MRFKSIFARIIFLHVIALVIVSIFMPLALYWFMRSAANDLHHQAMLEQADVVSYCERMAAWPWIYRRLFMTSILRHMGAMPMQS
jgi:hypothetical protein